jgi:hypothetical protein
MWSYWFCRMCTIAPATGRLKRCINLASEQNGKMFDKYTVKPLPRLKQSAVVSSDADVVLTDIFDSFSDGPLDLKRWNVIQTGAGLQPHRH